jgi:hypothetical protein
LQTKRLEASLGARSSLLVVAFLLTPDRQLAASGYSYRMYVTHRRPVFAKTGPQIVTTQGINAIKHVRPRFNLQLRGER